MELTKASLLVALGLLEYRRQHGNDLALMVMP